MKGPFKLKYKKSAFPFKGDKSNYDQNEAYFQALLKAVQEDPNPGTEETAESTPREVITPSKISEHHKSIYDRASQIQIQEYQKSQLKLNK